MTPPLRDAMVLAAGFMTFVAWDQSHWWRVKEDYGFGWLVPAFVAFVVYDRRERIRTGVQACLTEGGVRVRGTTKWVLRAGAGLALAGGMVVFLLGAFYRAGMGASQPGTLAMTLGMISVVLALIYLNTPAAAGGAAAAGGGWWRDARVRLTALFVFPVLVWLVSAPMVPVVEAELKGFLLNQVVSVVGFVFGVLGLPLEQQGNVLVLPTGSVGVEDACSGIRSLTGCLFAGSFLAAVFLDRLGKKIALVVAAMMLALGANLLRGLFLTAWAYRHGARAIEGTVHDVAGYAVLGLTVAGLLGLLPLFNLRLNAGSERAVSAPARPEERPGE